MGSRAKAKPYNQPVMIWMVMNKKEEEKKSFPLAQTSFPHSGRTLTAKVISHPFALATIET